MVDFEEFVPLLREIGYSEGLIAHTKAVFRITSLLVALFRRKGVLINADLALKGAVLHDIGRVKTHDVAHGVVGASLARQMGFPEAIVRIIERHVGAGIPLEEAVKIGLPPKDYLPESLEEKIVCYADKLVEGSRCTGLGRALLTLSKSLSPDHPSLPRLCRLHKEIWRKVGSWPKWI